MDPVAEIKPAAHFDLFNTGRPKHQLAMTWAYNVLDQRIRRSFKVSHNKVDGIYFTKRTLLLSARLALVIYSHAAKTTRHRVAYTKVVGSW